MPEISRFYGIVVQMYFNDHAPPHFHAIYGDDELIVGIDPAIVLAGKAPARVSRMVLEWAELHRTELQNNWDRCRAEQPIVAIAPLV
jgi:hypothetical protein